MFQVLVADDEEIEIRALEMMIRHDFPEEVEIVPGAKNGLELIAGIQKYQPDIVIADINMPGMNGIEALELIRAKYPRMKILISTAYSDFDYIRRALKLGAVDYLLKPVDRETFQKTFSALLARTGQERFEEDAERKIRRDVGEMQSIAGNEFLSSLLLGDVTENSFNHYLRSLPHPYHGTVVMMVQTSHDGTGGSSNMRKGLQKTISGILSQYCSVIGKSYRSDLYFLIFLPDEMDDARWLRYLKDLAELVSKKLKDYPVRLEFSFSRKGKTVQEIELCLEECRLALSQQEPENLHFYRDPENRDSEELPVETRQHIQAILKNEGKDEPEKLSGHLQQAILYMRQNYAQDLSLEDVAAQADISSFYLSRLFRQELRCTFVEELTQIRIRQAMQLMKQSRLSMREIAVLTGYRNVTYFYKVFRKSVGAGAGEVRELLRSGMENKMGSIG
ncbi:MAG: response regulator [Lachnospiraceae bacterium]|nr:response regulator [Lachnospiraceae bacterium]